MSALAEQGAKTADVAMAAIALARRSRFINSWVIRKRFERLSVVERSLRTECDYLRSCDDAGSAAEAEVFERMRKRVEARSSALYLMMTGRV